ncbi:MAG TPA: vWA domain-containing protein, partial [Kofleriaceae bacterium]
GEPTAVEIVFCGNATWTAGELELMESAIDHVMLPEGSTIGAVSYATGATLRAEATPKVRFGAGFLGYVPLYKDATGSDMVQGMTMGLSELRKANAPRKTLVVVGDGNDTNNEPAAGMLHELRADAEKRGIEIRAVLAPGKAETPGPIEQAGIQTFDAGKVDLTRALALAMGGTVQPPSVVEVVYEGRGAWMNEDVLRAIGSGMSDIDLPPGSRIGAISYSAGAGTVIPLEPLASFKPAQLGIAKGYAANKGSDLVVGVMMGVQLLAEAPEADKVLIVIGDGHDTRDETAAAKMDDLREQAKQMHVRVRALQYGSLDTLPGHLLKHLDPHVSEFSGNGYEGRLQGLQMALTVAPETIPARGGHAFDSAE